MSELERFLVELHRPRQGWRELQALAARARAAAEQLNGWPRFGSTACPRQSPS